eukprot:14319828-Heterocapsa_arctica.AAC.1
MAEGFSHQNAQSCMDILGSLERCVADKDQVRKKERDNYKPATTDMAVVVPHGQMGKPCAQIKSIT